MTGSCGNIMLRQQKLCEIGGCLRPAPKTILDLPKHIRRRIYLHCGLAVHQKVLLTPRGRPSNPYAQYYPTDFQLFYTCKTTRDEATAIFFSENHFVVPYSHIDKGLKYLQQLPPKAISKLSWLCVHLHVEPTQDSWPDLVEDYYDSFFETWSPTPLSRDRVRSWREVAGHLMRHSLPGTLNLHLACHSLDEVVIAAILQPLTKHPGVLKDFDFHLNTKVNLDKIPSALTRDIALPVTFKEQRQICTKPFRYLDLPTEIQERILANTDLVTPTRELYWNLNGKYTYCVGETDEVHCNSNVHKGLEPQYCLPFRCRIESRVPCHKHRHGYGICSQCWTPPQSVMLTNRTIREHAIRVLWRYNRVVIYPWVGYDYAIEEPSTEKQLLQFYRFITTAQPFLLRNLRNLELFLPNIAFNDPLETTSSDEPTIPSTVADHWQSAITQLRDCADVERLTVTVNMMVDDAVRGQHNHSRAPSFYGRGPKSKQVLLLSLENHIRCLHPLQLLRHMKRFYVRLEPLYTVARNSQTEYFDLSYENLSDVDENKATQSILHNLRRAEALLEKSVMGEDYDSELLGKGQETPSSWIKTYVTLE